MKVLIFTLFLLFSFPFLSKADKEIVIIRVEYASKKTGIESRLFCDIGVKNTHSLYRALTNQENTVQIKDENDKTLVFTSEVDLMNYLFTLGYNFVQQYTSEILTSKYMNFVLVKE